MTSACTAIGMASPVASKSPSSRTAAIPAKCSRCLKPAPGYDHLPQRAWLFVPLWGIVTWFLYAARRVHCPEHGVVVEHVPWSDGKRPVTIAMMCFLSRWARRLSWRETARVFGTSWECVYRSVEWFVQWGLAHRKLEGVQSIGVDEIHWGKSKRADNFLTVIYQIDSHCRRLLWVGKRRTQATLRRGLAALGERGGPGTAVCLQRHVAAIPERHRRKGRPGVACVGPVPHHLAFEPGGGSSAASRDRSLAGGRPAQADRLKNMRWKLLRRGSRVRGEPDANWAGCSAANWLRPAPGRSKTSSNTSGATVRSDLGGLLS